MAARPSDGPPEKKDNVHEIGTHPVQALPLWRQSWRYIVEGLPKRLQPPAQLDTEQACFDTTPALTQAYAGLRGTGSVPGASVVLPLHVKEALPTLASCFASLFANTGAPETEVIVVLNGKATMQELLDSPLHAFCQGVGVPLHHISYVEDPRYVDIKRPQNIFIPKQRGLDVAEGAVVLHTDVDCYYHPGWIAAYCQFFAAHPTVQAGYGPVYYDPQDSGPVGRSMTAGSTLVKGLKILAQFPPLAGHNHALRRDVRDVASQIYGSLTMNCQIMTGLLVSAMGQEAKLAEVVSFVPGALVATRFPKSTTSPGKAAAWILEAARRNVRNYKAHKRNVTS